MEILPKVLDRVETIHVTDMRHRGSFSPTAIGSGVTPNRAVFQYLKANGFDGWLCIEEASGRGFAGVRDAYEYVNDPLGRGINSKKAGRLYESTGSSRIISNLNTRICLRPCAERAR